MPIVARRRSWLLALLLAAACSAEDGAPAPGADPAPVGPPPDTRPTHDETAALFDPDRLLEIDIELSEPDWDALRQQTRSISSFFSAECLAAPFESPFTYFPGRVTVDGRVAEQVGVRKKGFFGSLDTERPSLKVKLDEYVADQRLSGVQKLTLNNAKSDPSKVKQCIAYRLFADAGVPAPRCNFARVRVNGRDLGVYVNVEGVDEDMLARHFADAEGNLYEGSLSDFRPGWLGTFAPKENQSTVDGRDLAAVADALAAPDDRLLAALEPVVDVDAFLSFWAMEVIVAHWDGYANNANNFFAYADPTSGKFHFLPWGVDAVFLDQHFLFEQQGAQAPQSVAATGLLARRLYLLPAVRARYVERVRELLDGVWDEAAILAEVDRMAALIAPVVDDPDGGHAGALEGVRAFVRGRRQAILAELDAGAPAWDYALRDTFCFAPIGHVSGTFATTWNSTSQPDPFAGSTASLSGEVQGVPLPVGVAGAAAGLDTQSPEGPRAIVYVIAPQPDGTVLVVLFSYRPEHFVPGARTPDWDALQGILFRFDPATDTSTTIGMLGQGTVELDRAATTPGGPVSGRFSVDVHELPL